LIQESAAMSELDFEMLPETLRSVKTWPLLTIRFDVREPTNLGPTPQADYRNGVITGGRFDGERLRGIDEDGGSDWQMVRSDRT
jgi:hypothetical protein